jgi:hypothetical protein
MYFTFAHFPRLSRDTALGHVRPRERPLRAFGSRWSEPQSPVRKGGRGPAVPIQDGTGRSSSAPADKRVLMWQE